MSDSFKLLWGLTKLLLVSGVGVVMFINLAQDKYDRATFDLVLITLAIVLERK